MTITCDQCKKIISHDDWFINGHAGNCIKCGRDLCGECVGPGFDETGWCPECQKIDQAIIDLQKNSKMTIKEFWEQATESLKRLNDALNVREIRITEHTSAVFQIPRSIDLEDFEAIDEYLSEEYGEEWRLKFFDVEERFITEEKDGE